MLRVVSKSPTPEDTGQPGTVVEYQPPGGHRPTEEPPVYYRPLRRSVGARVRATTRLAITIAAIVAITYFAARSSVLDTVLASFGTRNAAVVPDVAPGETATIRPAGPPKPVRVTVQSVAPATTPETARIPDVESLVALIRSAVVSLQQANDTGNYAVLRELAAPDFRDQNTPASLSETFTSLRERGTDLGLITVVNPRLYREPTIDGQGLLRLAGFFQADAEKVDFEVAFQQQNGRWRLYGIGLHPPKDVAPPRPKAVAPDKVPEAADLVSLIRGAVLALNQANNSGDYSVLRDIAAPGFQQANSLPRLATLFASLRGRGLDLSPVAVIDPKLSRPPAIDKNGYLRLSGFFPSRPEQVNFELVFAVSGGAWRLFGIGLETAPTDAAVASQANPN
jgi:hypothetical protein